MLRDTTAGQIFFGVAVPLGYPEESPSDKSDQNLPAESIMNMIISGLHLRFAVSILIFCCFFASFNQRIFHNHLTMPARTTQVAFAPGYFGIFWEKKKNMGHTRRPVIRFPIVFPQKRTDSESLKKILWLLNILYVNRADFLCNKSKITTVAFETLLGIKHSYWTSPFSVGHSKWQFSTVSSFCIHYPQHISQYVLKDMVQLLVMSSCVYVYAYTVYLSHTHIYIYIHMYI